VAEFKLVACSLKDNKSSNISFMVKYLLLLLFFLSIKAKSQFAIIDEKNGYINIMNDSSSNSEIAGRLYNDDVFHYNGFSFRTKVKAEWNHIFQKVSLDKIELFKREFFVRELNYNKNDFICHGYIQKKVIHPLEKLEIINTRNLYPINDWRSEVDDSICFINDTLSLTIKTGKFNIAEHMVDRSSEPGKEYIERIDDKEPYGILGDNPRVEIKSITLMINSASIEIPKTEYQDCFQPRVKNLMLRVDRKGAIYIYMPGNSDGAGGYLVVWIIKGHKYLKRYIDGY
jgi:hypothetical protein